MMKLINRLGIMNRARIGSKPSTNERFIRSRIVSVHVVVSDDLVSSHFESLLHCPLGCCCYSYHSYYSSSVVQPVCDTQAALCNDEIESI